MAILMSDIIDNRIKTNRVNDKQNLENFTDN